jgi:2-methylisocitrate lyase-like PEP mutase family enzyme
MTTNAAARAETFRALHGPGKLLVLANAWDAGSARIIESCGAPAIATTSAGLAWSRGYSDGNLLPPRLLAAAVAEIARVLAVPLSVDFEGGYASDPKQVAENIAAILDGGAVGINLEDGSDSPDLFCAKLEALKKAAQRAGIPLFVNARADVFLRKLVPAERALDDTIARGERYRAAGADGFFVPGLTDRAAIARIARAVALPLNVILAAGLPPLAELQSLGVRRVSAGSRITQAAYRVTRETATALLRDGNFAPLVDPAPIHPELNALFAQERR